MEMKKLEDQIELAEQVLNQFENKIGLPTNSPPGEEQELNQYLSMDRNDIERLSPVECGIIGYRLSQFSFYIQRTYNRCQSIVTWVETKLNRTLAQCIGDYDKFMKHDMKVGKIASENEEVHSLLQLQNYTNQRAKQLEHLSFSLKSLSDAIEKVGRMKNMMKE
jgi:hypothetical protein